MCDQKAGKKRGCCNEKLKLEQPSCTKKTNLLVYQAKGECCERSPTKSYVPHIPSPQMKRIKVCSAAELKKICAPPPCPCPPKIQRPGLLRRLAQLAGFGMKTIVALSAVYVSYDMGIWGDSETTGTLYKKICGKVMLGFMNPLADKQIPAKCKPDSEFYLLSEKDRYCCDKFPIDSEGSFYKIKQQWNKTVTSTFTSVAGLPGAVCDWANSLMSEEEEKKDPKKKK